MSPSFNNTLFDALHEQPTEVLQRAIANLKQQHEDTVKHTLTPVSASNQSIQRALKKPDSLSAAQYAALASAANLMSQGLSSAAELMTTIGKLEVVLRSRADNFDFSHIKLADFKWGKIARSNLLVARDIMHEAVARFEELHASGQRHKFYICNIIDDVGSTDTVSCHKEDAVITVQMQLTDIISSMITMSLPYTFRCTRWVKDFVEHYGLTVVLALQSKIWNDKISGLAYTAKSKQQRFLANGTSFHAIRAMAYSALSNTRRTDITFCEKSKALCAGPEDDGYKFRHDDAVPEDKNAFAVFNAFRLHIIKKMRDDLDAYIQRMPKKP